MSADTATQTSATGRGSRAAAWALGCGLCIFSFWQARELNGGYALPASHPWSVPPSEQVFYLWFAICGSLAVVCLAQCFTELGLAPRLSRFVDRAAARPGAWIACIALFVFAASALFRWLVLLEQPVTDDEGTYRLIARTLLTGHVTNPVPHDAEFFKNQFVVINAHGWHGKYPIGHPLVLALGEAIGAIGLVLPLVGAVSVWLTYRVGAKLFDLRVAIAGASLLLVSPHFVWTCATLLSQPTLCLALLLGMWLVLNDADQPRARSLLLAGFVFGFGILVRPLPGGLFAVVAAAQLAVDARKRGDGWSRVVLRLALFAAAALPWLGVFAAVNHAQSGSPFTSGYQEVHANLKLLQNGKGEIVQSIFGSLMRENFWLLTWPFALALLPWCRPKRAPVLFWGMLGAQIVYRVVAPKTVVSVTGPIYLTEVVPLLTLAVADALRRIGEALPRVRVRPSVVALAATLVGSTMFEPLQLEAIAVGAATRNVVYDELDKSGAEKALIFTNAVVYPQSYATWANYPDNPSPGFDDRWLFVRVPVVNDPRPPMLEFWHRRFPDRRAFVFAVGKEAPVFRELGP
jgi:hypothetical protein